MTTELGPAPAGLSLAQKGSGPPFGRGGSLKHWLPGIAILSTVLVSYITPKGDKAGGHHART